MYTLGGNNGWLVAPWAQPGRSEIYASNVSTSQRLPDMDIFWSYAQADPDFDGTAGYQMTDMNTIVSLIANQTYDPDADLDYNGEIEPADRDLMFDVLDSVLGDVNDDGIFNSTDLVILFQAGKYETQQAALYTEGDFNADGVFDSGDLVEVFVANTYSAGATALTEDWENILE